MEETTGSEQKILEAARRVFEQHGFAGARMQHIANEAGISKASLHYYFRSKEKLFDKIFEDTMGEFFTLVSTWNDDTEHWEKKLRHFVHSFLDFLQTKSLLFLLGEINRNPELLLSRKKKSRSKAKFILYFEKLRANHTVKGCDPHIAYLFLHSLCSYPILNARLFRVTLGLNDKEFDDMMRTYPDTVADTLIHLLKKGF